ncbi:alpha/beta hydrolase [Lacticaseibacillus songhuajiangensis]|jgi:acetyl esterase/lipase|uniref:alpha/beta hydrolase n=1 Tax=Lacticaseibacillus songhuajiangensis TaxID=1296539 RepID=UPI000F777DC3|nr:alpha/beta hydrolase [Lacticaseibacillus songhuajiangensis]
MIRGGFRLDTYWVKKGAPFALIIPGGGYWGWMNVTEGRPIARFLNAQGINAYVLRYRLRSRGRAPWPVADVQKAVRLIMRRDTKHVDTRNWSIWGASAGGHLACEYCNTARAHGLPLPKALALLYPVVTMGAATNRYTRWGLMGMLAAKPTIRAHSAERHVTANFPPTFIAASRTDGIVPYQNSVLLAKAIAAAGGHAQLRLYHQGRHGVGFGLRSPIAGWADAALQYWLAQTR